MAIRGKGVADAGVLGLGEFLVYGVVEVLYGRLVLSPLRTSIGAHTGPVMVEFALLVHVPTSSAGTAAVWACACRTATPESRRAAIRDNMMRAMCGCGCVRTSVEGRWCAKASVGARRREGVRVGR